MTIKIDSSKLVRANYVEGYSWSIFGNPKLKIICGTWNKLGLIAE